MDIISHKKQFVLTVIEKTEKQAPNTAIVKKCNIVIDYFDTQELAIEYLKKHGSELEKYAITECRTVYGENLKL